MPFDGSEFSGISVVSPAAYAGGGWFSRVARLWGRRPTRALFPGSLEVSPEPTATDLLRQARAVIAEEGRWAQGRYSTLDGRHCAIGALRTVTRDVSTRRAGKRAHAVLRSVALENGFGSVEQMNDRWSHAEVLRAFDRAIIISERSSATYM